MWRSFVFARADATLCHAAPDKLGMRARLSSGCASVCVCVCAACLHVILSRRWQVRESNVMRLSPLWFKHEHGNEGETERGSQFSFSKRRPSLQLCNSLPHFYCKEDPSDKKKKKKMHFLHLLHGSILQTFIWLVLECIRHEKTS